MLNWKRTREPALKLEVEQFVIINVKNKREIEGKYGISFLGTTLSNKEIWIPNQVSGKLKGEEELIIVARLSEKEYDLVTDEASLETLEMMQRKKVYKKSEMNKIISLSPQRRGKLCPAFVSIGVCIGAETIVKHIEIRF